METISNQNASKVAAKGKDRTTSSSKNQDSPMQECIDICYDCSKMCLEMIPSCLGKGEKHADPTHILLLQNCAEICRTSAQFMMTNSAFSNDLCSVCADVCRQCAEDCDSFGDDEMMKQCAEVCRACADSCEGIAKMA